MTTATKRGKGRATLPRAGARTGVRVVFSVFCCYTTHGARALFTALHPACFGFLEGRHLCVLSYSYVTRSGHVGRSSIFNTNSRVH